MIKRGYGLKYGPFANQSVDDYSKFRLVWFLDAYRIQYRKLDYLKSGIEAKYQSRQDRFIHTTKYLSLSECRLAFMI